MARALDFTGEQIAAGRVTVQKHDKRDKHGNRKGFSHYTLRRNVTLELRDLDRLGELMTGLLVDGDLNARLVWRTTAADSVQHALKLQAVRDARDKAVAMAAELDARVGPPLIISEWPIITDTHEVDRLSREAGIILNVRPERIRVTAKAYVRFELLVETTAPGTGLGS